MITIQFANGRTKTVSERRVVLAFALFFFLVVFSLLMIPPRCPITRRESSRTVAAMRPTMGRIANHGVAVSTGAVPAGSACSAVRPSPGIPAR